MAKQYNSGENIPQIYIKENFIVTWDGVEYRCVLDENGRLGDTSGSFTDYPFMIAFNYGSAGYTVETGSEASTHTFKIERVKHDRIPSDYLGYIYDTSDATGTPLTLVDALNLIADAASTGIVFSEVPIEPPPK